MALFNLQGKVKLSTIAINNTLRAAPVKLLYVGAVPNMTFELGAEEFPHFEAESGRRQQDHVLQGGRTGSITAALEDLSLNNMELILHSTRQAQSTTPVTGMAFPSGVEAGDEFNLPDVNISSVTIVDSAGTPATLPSGQYTVDANLGCIVFDDITTGGPYTQPFVIDYTPGAATSVPYFTESSAPERMLQFHGVNTVDNAVIIAEFYRVQIPVSVLDALKHPEGAYGNIPFNPQILADTTRPTDDVLGQFGRMIIQ